jgi:hypothetical protein
MTVRRARTCRPTIQPLEERVVMTLSFSGLVHSVFPFIKDNSKTAHVAHTPAEKARQAARVQEIQAARDGRAAAVAAARASGRHAAHPVTTGPVMYGPYLGRPGSYRHVPPLVSNPSAHTKA